jgi:hypothetical protein
MIKIESNLPKRQKRYLKKEKTKRKAGRGRKFLWRLNAK